MFYCCCVRVKMNFLQFTEFLVWFACSVEPGSGDGETHDELHGNILGVNVDTAPTIGSTRVSSVPNQRFFRNRVSGSQTHYQPFTKSTLRKINVPTGIPWSYGVILYGFRSTRLRSRGCAWSTGSPVVSPFPKASPTWHDEMVYYRCCWWRASDSLG